MNIKEIKQIKLQDFLASMGCKPVKQYGVNLMYLSPLRTEKHASFKVNTEINQWYDFGIGRGGNIIALAELLYNSSDVSYLIHQIERNAPSSVSGSLPTVKPITPQNSFEHLQVLPITHPALIKYLEERCIDIETARTVCVRSCTLIQGASITLVLAFPISQVVTKYAIRSSKAALHQKTSVISMQKSQRKYVLFSRASWTFCHL